MTHMRKAQIIQLEGGDPALHYKGISQPYLDQSQATHGYLLVYSLVAPIYLELDPE